mgnify:CR=1
MKERAMKFTRCLESPSLHPFLIYKCVMVSTERKNGARQRFYAQRKGPI